MADIDYDAIRKNLYERFHDAFEKLYVSELKDQLAEKDEIITALNHTIDELQSHKVTETDTLSEHPMGGGCYVCESLGELNENQAAEIESLKIQLRGEQRRIEHLEWLVDKYRDDFTDERPDEF